MRSECLSYFLECIIIRSSIASVGTARRSLVRCCGAASETTKIRPQILEKFDLEFLQRSIGRTVGVHMERATRACHATPKVPIDWRRNLGSQSLLAQLDKSPVAAALTTAGGIATWCSNRKRPFPDTGDMGAYMCVHHPTSNSRAPVAAATTTGGGIAARYNRKRPPGHWRHGRLGAFTTGLSSRVLFVFVFSHPPQLPQPPNFTASQS